MKLTDEQRRRMLEEALEHKCSLRTIAVRYGISYDKLWILLARARVHGVESVLHANRHNNYTSEFKIEVAKYIKAGASYTMAMVKYNLPSSSLGKQWFLKYTEGGAEALLNASRSRVLEQDTDIKDKQKGRRVHTESEYRKLEKRLKHAEMEVEFLKKLHALVQERIEREMKR